MISFKSYRQGVQHLVAACDEELLGAVYKEGKFRLDVARLFYDGERVAEDALLAGLRSCTVANLVGERTVAAAVKAGFVDPDNVKRVQGVPHAQYLVLVG